MSSRLSHRHDTATAYDQLYADIHLDEAPYPDLPHIGTRLLLPPATVLDLGSGVRNSLALARQGFTVLAYDLSPVAISHLHSAAAKENLALHGEIRDVTRSFNGSYDIILFMGLLHELTPAEAQSLVCRVQHQTNPGGLNVITAYTKNSDFYRQQDGRGFFLDNARHLIGLYEGWRVEMRDTRTMSPSNAPEATNTYQFAVFRRPTEHTGAPHEQ